RRWRAAAELAARKRAAVSAGRRGGDAVRRTSSYCTILVRPATTLPSPTASRRRPARTSPLRTSTCAERAGDAATARHLPRARATGQGGGRRREAPSWPTGSGARGGAARELERRGR